MKILSTRAGSFLTGDDVADAVLDYDLALSRRRTVALVSVPFLDHAHERSAQFVIGWNANVSAVSHEEFDRDELHAPDTVSAFRARAAALGPVHAEPFDDFDLIVGTWPTYE